MYNAGDKPGKGTYKCVKCGYIIELKNDNDVLPVCPKCKATKWMKL